MIEYRWIFRISPLTTPGLRKQARPLITMPALKNPKHERFAQLFAVSGNASAAWREVTGKTKDADAHSASFMVIHGMKARIDEIRAGTAAKSERKKSELYDFLWQAVDGEIEVKPEQLRAAEIIARMTGWNEPDKIETDGKMEIIIRKE